jgi:putative ABC transport system permease protein
MAIPFSYNLRNLVVRKTTTLMTAMGIGLTVAVLLAVLALVEGLRTSFEATGHPLNILVMRKGASAELTSVITREQYQDMKLRAGIARGSSGEPLASLEMVTLLNASGRGKGASGMNVNLRGITGVGFDIRDELRLIAGRRFQPGRREAVVGKSIAERYPSARIGNQLRFGRGEWEVVGIMDGGRSAVNSEVFVDLNQLSADFNRSEHLSSVLLRATDAVAMQALQHNLENDPRLNILAKSEREYYAAQTTSALPVQFMGIFVSIIMAVGSSFAAMNTMYAAVARRSGDIGVLRVLGFSRGSILASFLVESVVLSCLGGALGCLLVLPLNNLNTRVGSFVTFSEVTFQLRVSPRIMAAGLGFALLMGALGGLFPARTAARKEILAAFRAV